MISLKCGTTKKLGPLGSAVSEASALGSGHDLRVLGSSPMLGSLLSEKPVSLSPSTCLSAYLCALVLSLSLSLSLSLLKRKSGRDV